MKKILQAAIKTKDGRVWTLPKPARHGDIIKMIIAEGGNTRESVQGFLDLNLDFINRGDAYKIALNADQLLPIASRNIPILFSEDVW